MLERDIEWYLVMQVELIGGWTRKSSWVGRSGSPDRIVILNNKLYWVELKKKDGKLSKVQQREFSELRRHGQTVIVIWSIEGCDKFIEKAVNVK